ncbi:MAG: insulinase family protein, partial [Gammaproteobacteria bacterium]|nr:insulinase family protein [Gammaproteobacteria bacterium]
MYAKPLAFIAAAVLCSSTFAAPQIQQWQTANGARVLFVPAPEIPMVDAQVVFNAGSARDLAKPGIAVMTNALLNEGAGDKNADAIAEQFASLGAHQGNGAERDMASFSLRSLTDPSKLQPAAELLALILKQPTFPPDAFVRVQSNTLVGLQAQKQSPDEIASEAFFKAVYGSHPYASEPSGTEDSVKALTVDDLKAFYKQYYVARNAVVAIVGAVDRAAAEKLANTLVSGLPEGVAAAKLPEVVALADANVVKLSHPSTQTHVMIGQPGIQRNDPDYFALYLGNHILGGNGLVSRISDEIREKRGLSYSAYSYFMPMRERGPYVLGLQTRTEKTDEAIKVLRDTLDKFVKDGPTAKELEASKKNITGGF